MSAISCASLRILPQFGTQGLSNIAWAFSVLAVLDLPFMNSIASPARAKITAFQAQELSNTAWAFSSLRLKDIPLLDAISAASLTKIRDGILCSRSEANPPDDHDSCTPLHLSITAWSFATLECSDWPLLNAIAAASLPPILQFDAQCLSNTVWAFASCYYLDWPLSHSIAA